MALRKYRHLNLFREYVNQILPLNFPEANYTAGDLVWMGAESQCAELKFETSTLSGVECKIHNYMMYVIFPEDFREEFPYFQQIFNFTIPEMNIWVKSEGRHLRVYPRDRNDYDDTEINHRKRAVYFISCLYVVLKWVQREMINDHQEAKSL